MVGFNQEVLENVKNLDEILVKFTYHQRERTVKPFEMSSKGLSGWVVSEPGEAVQSNRWVGDDDAPFKAFIAGKMTNVRVVPDRVPSPA